MSAGRLRISISKKTIRVNYLDYLFIDYNNNIFDSGRIKCHLIRQLHNFNTLYQHK